MSILQCDIFWWKLIDRNFFNLILIPRSSSGHPPFFAVSTVLHVIISKQDIHICQIFHIYSTLSSVLKPKYSLSIRNKCVYLLEASESASIIPPKIAIFRMCYGENGAVKFLKTLADNALKHNYSMMQIKKKLNNGKMLRLPRPTPLNTQVKITHIHCRI